MSVLIEALCLVVPNVVLDVSYPGGASAFIDEKSMLADVRYAVTDGTITAVSMFLPAMAIELTEALEMHGIVGAQDRAVVEFAFVDMHTGSTLPCEWLETAHHPHGFMIAWHSTAVRGNTVMPGDWDPSFSWGLERTDIDADTDVRLRLTTEDGFRTALDFDAGYLDESLDTPSPVVPVGRGQPGTPEHWELVSGLPASLHAVQQMLQRAGIPFHVERHTGAIRIPFACDVTVHDADGLEVEREIRQRVLVTAGPGVHDLTSSTVLPMCVPVHLRGDAEQIATMANRLCTRLRMDFEAATGTVAMATLTFANGQQLDDKAVERAVAASSPVAGECYEVLLEWLAGLQEVQLAALNIAASQLRENE